MPCYRRKLKKGFRWYYDFNYLGIRHHSKCIYLTAQEAKIAEADKIKEVDLKARKGFSDIKLLDLCSERLDQIKLNQSKAYYQENRRYFKMLLNFTGNVYASQINKLQIVRLLNKFSGDLKKKGRDNYNVNSMLRSLKALFYYAINIHDIDIKNPCQGIRPFPISSEIKFIPSNGLIEQALLKCDDKECLLIAFCLETGCRINEALRFSDKDVLENEIVLYTRKSKNSDLSSRKVPTPLCIRNLTFKGRLFKRWNVYPRFLEKKGGFGFHSLRHRYASLLSKRGKPLYRIMELLGHNSIKTTQIYLQTLP